MALYLMGIYADDGESWFQKAWKATGKKLDMGKSCVRFTRLDDVALDVVGDAIRARRSTSSSRSTNAAAPERYSGSVPAPAMLRIASGTGGGGAGRSPAGARPDDRRARAVDRRADLDAVAVDAEVPRVVAPGAAVGEIDDVCTARSWSLTFGLAMCTVSPWWNATEPLRHLDVHGFDGADLGEVHQHRRVFAWKMFTNLRTPTGANRAGSPWRRSRASSRGRGSTR